MMRIEGTRLTLPASPVLPALPSHSLLSLFSTLSSINLSDEEANRQQYRQ